MRLALRHEIAWTWTGPPRSVLAHLRIEPGNYEGQHVVGWRMDVQPDGRRHSDEDGFGNCLDSLTVDGPLSVLTLRADAEIETYDTTGIVRHSIERFPPELFLRDSALTQANAALRNVADEIAGKEGNALARAHALMYALHERIEPAQCTDETFASAGETLAEGRGHAREIAHVFIASARHLGIPARIAVGHLYTEDAQERACMHGWAEAHVDGIGWIGFDCVRGRCPEGAHIRVAVGIDALDALAVRSAHHGGSGESIAHRISVRPVAPRAG